MNDQFSRVHEVIKSRGKKAALSMLLNKKTGRIKKPYNMDLNHAWYIVGDIFYKLSDYNNAIRAFKNSFKNWTGDVEALWAIANCYSNLGKPWLAKFYLEKAISIDGNKADLKFNLGNAYFDMGKYREAIDQYKKVGKKDKKLSKLAALNLIKAERLLTYKR